MARRIASRLSLVGTSPTLAVKMEADRLRREGKTVIDFGPGEPDFPTPEAVKEAGIAAIRADFTKYTSAPGIHDLRAALASHYASRSSTPIEPEHVLVGVGGKSLLFELMLALLNPGDEALLHAPYWVSFPEQVKLAGGTVGVAMLDASDGFTIRAEKIAEAITPSTTLLVLNGPCNPTGAILPRGEAEAIAELAVERDLWVVSDETYESFVYDDADRFSMLELREALGDRLVFVSAFSKTWSMTGWRIGYAIADPRIVKAALKIQSHNTTHAASMAQKAALAALVPPALDAPRAMLEEFRARRGLLVDGLDRLPGVSCLSPRGAFYAFPDVTGLMGTKGVASSKELCERLIAECGVAAVPGEAFGAPGHVRLSYATSRENIDAGLERLGTFAGGG